MIPTKLRSLLNSFFWVLGAVLIGAALNVSVVTGQRDLFAPVVIAQFLVGIVMVVIAYALRSTPVVVQGGPRVNGDKSDEDEFDPDLSPVGATYPSEDETSE